MQCARRFRGADRKTCQRRLSHHARQCFAGHRGYRQFPPRHDRRGICRSAPGMVRSVRQLVSSAHRRVDTLRPDDFKQAAAKSSPASTRFPATIASCDVGSQDRCLDLPCGAGCGTLWHRRNWRPNDEHALDPFRDFQQPQFRREQEIMICRSDCNSQVSSTTTSRSCIGQGTLKPVFCNDSWLPSCDDSNALIDDSYPIAIGFTQDPVAPVSFRGVMISKNS